MATRSTRPARDTLPGRFAAPPWPDDDPRRLDLDLRLAPDHLARQVDHAGAGLDLTTRYDAYAGTGSPAGRPDLLLRLALRRRAGLGRPIKRLLADTAAAGGADRAAAAAAGVMVDAPVPGDGVDKSTAPIPQRDFTWPATEPTYRGPPGHRLVQVERSRPQRSGTEMVVLDRYRCPAEHGGAGPLRERCAPKSGAGRAVVRREYAEDIEALRARMATPEAKAWYRLRGQTVERVNADGKQQRKWRRFSGRGLARVRGEVGLLVLAHNVLAFLTEQAKAAAPGAEAATPPGITT